MILSSSFSFRAGYLRLINCSFGVIHSAASFYSSFMFVDKVRGGACLVDLPCCELLAPEFLALEFPEPLGPPPPAVEFWTPPDALELECRPWYGLFF